MNDALSSNHSEFRPEDSGVNQLLLIYREIFSAFGNGLEVRGIFLDTSKASGKEWHDGVIFKLCQNGVLVK